MMPEPSYYQQLFLRRIKREKQLIVLWRTAVFLLFLLIWECSARYGLIDSFIFSSPSLIWKSFMEMCRDLSIFSHLGVTVTETLVSFFIVVILGAGLAVLLWCFPRLAQVTVPSGSGGSFVSSCTSWEALSAVPSCWLSAAIAGPVSVPAAITAASSRANVRLMG